MFLCTYQTLYFNLCYGCSSTESRTGSRILLSRSDVDLLLLRSIMKENGCFKECAVCCKSKCKLKCVGLQIHVGEMWLVIIVGTVFPRKLFCKLNWWLSLIRMYKPAYKIKRFSDDVANLTIPLIMSSVACPTVYN